jgi:hypothetical protein
MRGRITDDPDLVEELNATHERCRLLFMEQRERWVTRERVDSISAGLNPLYSQHPPTAEEQRGLGRLALVGWCWREAERGRPEAIRDSILASYRAALAEPEVRETLVLAWASWKFLADGGHPGLASPGRTKRLRLAFLEAAFEKMHEAWGATAGIDTARGKWAFHHGVVLNDVESLVMNRPSLI